MSPWKITHCQLQRLFLEHFSCRLLVAHSLDSTFSCSAYPSSQELAESVCNAVGWDRGYIASAIHHGCLNCTHPKCYASDLINENAQLGNEPNGIAEIAMEVIQDEVSYFSFQLINILTKAYSRLKLMPFSSRWFLQKFLHMYPNKQLKVSLKDIFDSVCWMAKLLVIK